MCVEARTRQEDSLVRLVMPEASQRVYRSEPQNHNRRTEKEATDEHGNTSRDVWKQMATAPNRFRPQLWIIDSQPALPLVKPCRQGLSISRGQKAYCVVASAPEDVLPGTTPYLAGLAHVRSAGSIPDTWVLTPATEGRRRTTRCCVRALNILRVGSTVVMLVALPFEALPVHANSVGVRRSLRKRS